jgi:hypothetical protein
MLSVPKLLYKLLDTPDLFVGLSRLLRHLVNGLLDAGHDFGLELDLVVGGYDGLYLADAQLEDFVQLLLDF